MGTLINRAHVFLQVQIGDLKEDFFEGKRKQITL